VSNSADRALPERALVERPWLSAEIDAWFRSGASTLLVVGSPGSGKSTALLDIERSHQVLLTHSCRYRDDRLINPLRLVERIVEALATQSSAFAAAIRTDPLSSGPHINFGDVHIQTGDVAEDGRVSGLSLSLGELSPREAFDRVVRRPWDALVARERPPGVTIVIDALDESLSWPGRETVASLLASAVAAPPRGMRFVLSARPRQEVVNHFPEAERIDLDAHSIEATADVRRLVTAVDPSSADEIARLADGNLLVATYLTNRPGLARVADPATGVLGLHQVYREFVDRELRMDIRRWRLELRPILSTLGVLRGPGVTARDLALIVGLPGPNTRDALDDLASFARPDEAGRWTLFHESFRDYLAADEEIAANPTQDLVVAERLIELCPDWWACEMPYALTNIAGHLLAAAADRAMRRHATERLATLISDARWLVARAVTGDGEQLLDDLHAVETSPHLTPGTAAASAAAAVNRQGIELRACTSPEGAARLAQQLAIGALSADVEPLRSSARALARALGAPFVDVRWLCGRRLDALRLVIPAHLTTIEKLEIAPDGLRAFSVGEDGVGKLWDLTTGSALLTLSNLRDAAVDWRHEQILVVGHDGELSLALLDQGDAVSCRLISTSRP
jgi:hypothetical protein